MIGRWLNGTGSTRAPAIFSFAAVAAVLSSLSWRWANARAVVNVNCLDDRGRFTSDPIMHDFDAETIDNRSSRRAANWMSAVLST
jgi:hypothetical protein